MPHRYRLFLALLLTTASSAAAQNWRPFRPNGDVHAFTISRNGAAMDSILTLRLDSAGVWGPDSVYFFNRIMRPAEGERPAERWRKSRNNQFGARLRYEAAAKVYWLEWAAEADVPARSVPLPVFLKEGAVFTGSSGPTVTAISRTVRSFAGQPDSVVTLRVGTETYEVSKSYGLVAGPLANGASLTLARLPEVAGRSYYNPLLLADFQPGDEFGYYGETAIFPNTLVCSATNLLQRIVSRQQTADSLIYVVRYQSRTRTSGAPGCPPAGITLQPPTTARLAASLRTGQWRLPSPGGAVSPSAFVQLLAYEWTALDGTSSTGVVMGHPVVASRSSSSVCGGAALLQTQLLLRARGGEETYLAYDTDLPPQYELLNSGLGMVRNSRQELVYYRRTGGTGTSTCGSRTGFDLLLASASRASAAHIRLYPNPAAATATLEFAAPATASAQLALLDVTGRTLRSQTLPAGATRAEVVLAGLPAGLYLVRLEQPERMSLVLRLQHVQ